MRILAVVALGIVLAGLSVPAARAQDPDEQRYRVADLTGLDAFVGVIQEGDILFLTITTLVPEADVGAPRRTGALRLHRDGTPVRDPHTVRWLDVAVDGWYLPTAAVSTGYQALLTDLTDHTVTPQDVTYRLTRNLAEHIVMLGQQAENMSPWLRPGDLVRNGLITLRYAAMISAIDPRLLKIEAVSQVLGTSVTALEPFRPADAESGLPAPGSELYEGVVRDSERIGVTASAYGWIVWLAMLAAVAGVAHYAGVEINSAVPYIGWLALAGAAAGLLPWGAVLAVMALPILLGAGLLLRRFWPA